MKKLLALVSLSVFLAFSVNAQTSKVKAPESKKEVTTEISKDAKSSSSHACSVKANASCCKSNKNSKACSAEQKAACAKAGKECTSHESKVSKEKAEVNATVPGALEIDNADIK